MPASFICEIVDPDFCCRGVIFGEPSVSKEALDALFLYLALSSLCNRVGLVASHKDAAVRSLSRLVVKANRSV